MAKRIDWTPEMDQLLLQNAATLKIAKLCTMLKLGKNTIGERIRFLRHMEKSKADTVVARNPMIKDRNKLLIERMRVPEEILPANHPITRSIMMQLTPSLLD